MTTQPFHHITSAIIEGETLVITVDGRCLRCPVTLPALLAASPDQQAVIDISPSGYGLYWPLLDIDLAIDPLIKSLQTEAA
jgi:hypothetical protein